MARQSIVDFFKDAQTTATPSASGVGGVEVEKAYAELAQPVLEALSGGVPLSEGDLFKRVNADNIGQFRAAVGTMKARGLVRVVALNQPFNDPVYGLGSGVGQG
ncbi:MAG TPA: hypothetical protein VGM42_18430 [Rhodopila sp.]|jgi:hypothetical protein